LALARGWHAGVDGGARGAAARNRRKAMDRRTFMAVVLAGGVAAGSAWAQGTATPPAPGAGPGPRGRGRRWDQQADGELQLGPGMARQLMTEEEWKEHVEKMRSMPPADRQKYREETHAEMVKRAKDRGITLPPAPGPHGPGAGGTR
jgi:Spy/CpxP family protein refolding chaperone